jgi:hypothetical protein
MPSNLDLARDFYAALRTSLKPDIIRSVAAW